MASAEPQTRLRYASIPSRMVAYALDLVVLAAWFCVFLVASFTPLLIVSDFGETDPPTAFYYVFSAVMVAYIPFAAFYHMFCWLWRGRTVGQWAMGIRVVRRSDGRLGLWRASRRAAGYLLFGLTLSVGALLFMLIGALVTGFLIAGLMWVAALALIGALQLLSFAFAAFDRERRALHDRLAGTVVVRES